ncbi:MAG: hypothetical protein GC146_12145 [Limimaricola sp.]|uniref:curli-like amyloid fiber formation chaperone CsgH n=1 Tax=Limimaricola sp. TaxID=2211665 RepID=UPI001D290E9E|nr:curli-like amyloid fiber formation chaperone CsgH [Limimaricola sp.]MBI1417965.1 hypothetical protein [Limimaricola sp.]
MSFLDILLMLLFGATAHPVDLPGPPPFTPPVRAEVLPLSGPETQDQPQSALSCALQPEGAMTRPVLTASSPAKGRFALTVIQTSGNTRSRFRQGGEFNLAAGESVALARYALGGNGTAPEVALTIEGAPLPCTPPS